MIRLGLRLAVSGGREALARLAIRTAAVGIGVGLLLTAVSSVNAVHTQNDRYAWLNTGAQYYASAALSALLRSTPADELADRYPGHQAGLIGQAGLPSPSSLVIVVGRSAAQLSHLPGAAKVASLNTIPPNGCTGQRGCVIRAGIGSDGIDVILFVAALVLLLPVLIFIGTATRLSAARRGAAVRRDAPGWRDAQAGLVDRCRGVHGGRRGQCGHRFHAVLPAADTPGRHTTHRPAVLPRRAVAQPARRPRGRGRRASRGRRRGPAGTAPGDHARWASAAG